MKNWRAYLLPSLLILALAGGLGIAQQITRSVQLSQDPSGPIGFDNVNGVYFPGHILSTGTTPTLSGCGGSTTVTGTDSQGTFTGTAGTAACTLIFARAYQAAPNCVVTSNSQSTSPLAYTLATTSIQVTAGIGAAKAYYWCSGAS
jgi:hypothetical protein